MQHTTNILSSLLEISTFYWGEPGPAAMRKGLLVFLVAFLAIQGSFSQHQKRRKVRRRIVKQPVQQTIESEPIIVVDNDNVPISDTGVNMNMDQVVQDDDERNARG